MNTKTDTPAQPQAVLSSAELGQAQSLVARLRTDVLWHQRRGNETIARDCQDAADEIQRLLSASVVMPPYGWSFIRNTDGSITITNNSDMGVVVHKKSIGPREIPEEVLYALAESFCA